MKIFGHSWIVWLGVIASVITVAEILKRKKKAPELSLLRDEITISNR